MTEGQPNSHVASFIVNNTTLLSTNTNEGEAITFPIEDPSQIFGFEFVGWSESEISGKTATQPTFVTSSTMGSEDKCFYAIYAKKESSIYYEKVNAPTIGNTYIFIANNANKALTATGLPTSASQANIQGIDISIETKEGKDIVNSPHFDAEFTYVDATNKQFDITASTTIPKEKLVINGNGIGKVSSDYKASWNESLGLYGTTSTNAKRYVVWSTNHNQFEITESTAGIRRVDAFEKKSETIYSNYCTNIDGLSINENDNELSSIDKQYDGVTLTRSMTAGKWSTLCLPFALTSEEIVENFGAGALVKTLSGVTVTEGVFNMTFEDAPTIAAGTPYLVKATKNVTTITANTSDGVAVNTTLTETARATTVSDGDGNSITFQGNFGTQTVAAGNYIIKDNKFYVVGNSGTTNKGYRGYFTIAGPNANKVKALNLDENVTGIEIVQELEQENNTMYDLQGRVIKNPRLGHLYIMQGKKYLNKK